ncbi:copper resistance CopC family protein [Novacetimonas pomaceti]|uniref:copper resistance CopC family protein n=1 Tax=Novacetimonas pomaceti TaxID=2021998 RepID=UPI001C2D001A|nr:copper resistance CopC family protein [Novacetimonas pomaceti]MBV1833415.1 copper resistance protein CopC [Novacetimonas pomaceti]
MRNPFLFLPAFLVGGMLCLGLARPAWASPGLVHATPAAGQNVNAGTVSIRLDFNAVIDPFHTRLVLLGPSGVPQLLLASPKDDEQQEIAVDVPLGTPGDYVLQWRAGGRASGVSHGSVPFHVVAPAGH